MERIFIKDTRAHIGKEVELAGWVDIRRDHGKLVFLDIRDGSGIIQTVALPQNAEAHATAALVRSEWTVRIRGIINKRPEKMVNQDLLTGDVELEAKEIVVLSRAEELPFDKDVEDLNIDTYLDHLPLTLRRKKARAFVRVQMVIVDAFRRFLMERGFTEIQVPKITGGDAEGGASVFAMNYFGKDAYLATSPQLYKQIMVGALERVFAIGNIYRAELHSTTRHLNEYTSMDLEFGFIKDHTDVMDLEEEFLHFLIHELRMKVAHECGVWNATIPEITGKIPRWTLREAQKIIEDVSGEKCIGEPDLEPAHERLLGSYAKEKYGSDFVFITHYPVSKRPFYTYEDEERPGFTKSFDMLFRGLEVTTGGQRIHDYEKLVTNIKKWKLDPEKFSFYLEAFKYGMPPEGGLAIGLERLTARLLGAENVRETTLFPRDMHRIDTRLTKEGTSEEEAEDKK